MKRIAFVLCFAWAMIASGANPSFQSFVGPTFPETPSNKVAIPYADVATRNVGGLPYCGLENQTGDLSCRNFILWAKGNKLNERGYQNLMMNNWWAPTNDASGNICFDPAIFNGVDAPIETAETWTNFCTTNGFNVAFQIDPTAVISGTEISSNWTKIAYHITKDWGAKLIMYDLSGDPGTTVEPPRTVLESMTHVLRAICYTNGLQGVHLTISCYINPHPFDNYIMNLANSWTLGPDGSSLWGDFTNHLACMSRVSAYVGPDHTYNFNILESYGGVTNMFKSALAARAIGPATIIVGDTNLTQLMLGCLTNPLLRQIHQDPMVSPGHICWITNSTLGEVWVRDLVNGQKAVMLLNKSTSASTAFNIPMRVFGLDNSSSYLFTDVWPRTNFTATGSLVRTLETNSADLFVITPIQTSFVRLLTTTTVPTIGDIGTNGSAIVISNGTVWLATATNGTVISTKLGP